jgi:Ca2+/Na+ antiporter
MVGGDSISSTTATRSGSRNSSPFAWDLLGLLGFALFVVGGSDFLLSWFPWRFGNPEWEFGTITAALNAMPAGLMGLTLLLIWAHQSESAVWTRVLSGVILIWSVVLVALAVIYGLTLPLAARGFAVPNVGVGLKRAIARSLVQLVIYPVVMLWMAARGFRQARSIT